MLKRYVVTYDIPATKRRTKIHAFLQGYGIRVNHSVFELTLTPIQMRTLIARLDTMIKPKEDSVRIYPLCKDCAKESYALGVEPVPFADDEATV